LISGREFRSPSAQLRITPLGDVEPLSTHDQMLGGPSGQAYLGCRFPASPDYAVAIMQEAMKVGHRLKREGVLGRFALDFVTVLNDRNEWEVYAIEINLRKGGTTHPYLTLQFLTDGGVRRGRGRLPHTERHREVLRRQRPRAFTSLPRLHPRRPLRHRRAPWAALRPDAPAGVVLHMVNGVGEQGSLGLTAVANSRADAEVLYERTVRVLDEEANAALAPRPLP